MLTILHQHLVILAPNNPDTQQKQTPLSSHLVVLDFANADLVRYVVALPHLHARHLRGAGRREANVVNVACEVALPPLPSFPFLPFPSSLLSYPCDLSCDPCDPCDLSSPASSRPPLLCPLPPLRSFPSLLLCCSLPLPPTLALPLSPYSAEGCPQRPQSTAINTCGSGSGKRGGDNKHPCKKRPCNKRPCTKCPCRFKQFKATKRSRN